MIKKIKHYKEYLQWVLVEKGMIEDICRDCIYYFSNTDYCKLDRFETDEKFGERLPINKELYNFLYEKNEN